MNPLGSQQPLVQHVNLPPVRKIEGPLVAPEGFQAFSSQASSAPKPNEKKPFSFGRAFGNFCKGLVSPITSLFESKQNFLMGVGMILAGGALILSTGGAATPLLIGLGVGMGVFQGGVGAYKFINAKDNEEREEAFHDFGAATSTIGLSALGARSSLKGAGPGVLQKVGLTAEQIDKMSMWQATVQNIKLTRTSVGESVNVFRSGKAWGNIRNVFVAPRPVTPPKPPVVAESLVSEAVMSEAVASDLAVVADSTVAPKAPPVSTPIPNAPSAPLLPKVVEPAPVVSDLAVAADSTLTPKAPSVSTPIPKSPSAPLLPKAVEPNPVSTNPTLKSVPIKNNPPVVSAPPKTTPPPVVAKSVPPAPVSPHTPHVRGSAALDATHLAENIATQLNAFSEAELASLLSGMNASDRALALQTLHRMTQFGKMKSLNGLADELIALQGRGYALIEDGVTGSLSSVLKYLRSKGSFSSLYFEDLNTSLTQGKKVAIILDDMMLGKLKSDPAFLQHLNNHSSQVRFVVPEGWQSGVNPFNQGSLNGVNSRMTTLMTRAKAIQATRGGTMEAALSEALTEPVLTQLDALSPGLSKQVIRVQHPEVSAGNIAKPDLSHVVSNLEAQGLSHAEIEAILNKLSPDPVVRQAALEMVMRSGEFYSPRRVGLALQDMHQGLLAKTKQLGVAPEDIYFVLRENDRSFTVMAQMYQQMNQVAPHRFILVEDIVNLPGGGGKRAYVILDDLMASGQTLMDVLKDNVLPKIRSQDQVFVSPVISTTHAKNVITPITQSSSNVHFLPGKVVPAFHDSPYFQSLSAGEKTLFEAIFQNKGYCQTNTNTVFPWMGTDTNNYFFGKFFVDPFLLNGKGNKVSASGWANPVVPSF